MIITHRGESGNYELFFSFATSYKCQKEEERKKDKQTALQLLPQALELDGSCTDLQYQRIGAIMELGRSIVRKYKHDSRAG